MQFLVRWKNGAKKAKILALNSIVRDLNRDIAKWRWLAREVVFL